MPAMASPADCARESAADEDPAARAGPAPASSTLIVTADDFGLCPPVDEAICLLHDRGLVGRTSFIVGMDGFDRSVELLSTRRGLRVGVHLNLTDGRPVLPAARVPTLVNRAGHFVGGRHYQVLASVVTGRFSRAEIRSEWRAQIARARGAGVAVTHLDSHGHLHLVPALHEVVLDLVEEFSVPFLRLLLSVDSPRHLALRLCSRRLLEKLRRRGLRTEFPRRIMGLARQGALDRPWLLRNLSPPPTALTELIVHPALSPNEHHRRWGYAGEGDLSALLAPDVAPLLRSQRPA
jgi:chitin disaccharide deacetylase